MGIPVPTVDFPSRSITAAFSEQPIVVPVSKYLTLFSLEFQLVRVVHTQILLVMCWDVASSRSSHGSHLQLHERRIWILFPEAVLIREEMFRVDEVLSGCRNAIMTPGENAVSEESMHLEELCHSRVPDEQRKELLASSSFLFQVRVCCFFRKLPTVLVRTKKAFGWGWNDSSKWSGATSALKITFICSKSALPPPFISFSRSRVEFQHWDCSPSGKPKQFINRGQLHPYCLSKRSRRLRAGLQLQNAFKVELGRKWKRPTAEGQWRSWGGTGLQPVVSEGSDGQRPPLPSSHSPS